MIACLTVGMRDGQAVNHGRRNVSKFPSTVCKYKNRNEIL